MVEKKSQKGVSDIILKRKIYQQLLDWKEKRNGETALLVEGARRIGKSYIVVLLSGEKVSIFSKPKADAFFMRFQFKGLTFPLSSISTHSSVTSRHLPSLRLPPPPRKRDSPSGRGRAQVTHVQWLAGSPSKRGPLWGR